MEDELSATDAQASDLWAKLRGGTAADVEVATAALLERGALRAGSEHIALLIIGALGRVGRCDRALTLLRRVELLGARSLPRAAWQGLIGGGSDSARS